MISYRLDTETNILETKFEGDIDAQSMIYYISSFDNNPDMPRSIKCIATATNANFKFKTKDLKAFNKIKNKILPQYEMAMVATIINSPVAAALSTMYSIIANNKDYKFKVFSTREAAMIWLDSF